MCSYVWTRCVLEATFSGDMSHVCCFVRFRSRDFQLQFTGSSAIKWLDYGRIVAL